MLITGMLFLVFAVVSGLYGFGGIVATPVHMAQTFSYTCSVLASLVFAYCLVRACAVRLEPDEERHPAVG